jgi:hypothetical protein
MLPTSAAQGSEGGQLAKNVLYFARVLRKAGLPIGTDRALLALKAVQLAGISSRADLRAVLQACLIDRVDHRAIFERAFYVFWCRPDLLDEALRLVPWAAVSTGAQRRIGNADRGNETLACEAFAPDAESTRERRAIGVYQSWSNQERLRKTDFDAMTAAEWTAAKCLITKLQPLLARIVTRRESPCTNGRRLDLRQMLRHSARHGGDTVNISRKTRRTRTESLVVMVDISGSMSRYSRMFLHFIHALANGPYADGLRIYAFVFGTRLTNVSRQLRARDPDEALARVVKEVDDWSGGTRIGPCLKDFNQKWGRRVPLASSTLLLMTDGLEHADIESLSAECARLSRSCRRLIWVNPLLRYDAFKPTARGICAILPHVNWLLPMHNVNSLEQLGRILGKTSSSNHPRYWSQANGNER